MGHQHIPRLPRTKEWKQVVNLLSNGGSLAAVAAAAAHAAEKSMILASEDGTVRHSFYLLTQIPQAAGSAQFARELGRLGINVSSKPTLVELCVAMMSAIDRLTLALRRRTDFGEIAQLSAVESIHAIAARELGDLFGSEGDRLPKALARMGTATGFATLARDFFSRLTRRHLNFYLQRELGNHVGADRRFIGVAQLRQFEDALDAHCREASGIMKRFANNWYTRHLHEDGIDERKAGAFVHVAVEKMRDELQARRDATP